MNKLRELKNFVKSKIFFPIKDTKTKDSVFSGTDEYQSLIHDKHQIFNKDLKVPKSPEEKLEKVKMFKSSPLDQSGQSASKLVPEDFPAIDNIPDNQEPTSIDKLSRKSEGEKKEFNDRYPRNDLPERNRDPKRDTANKEFEGKDQEAVIKIRMDGDKKYSEDKMGKVDMRMRDPKKEIPSNYEIKTPNIDKKLEEQIKEIREKIKI